jgi:C4-dicarboxylate-specific signal transduction histidine kinase
LPFVFNEHGALQSASVLKSDRAVAVSLLVVRIFVRMRQWAQTSRALVTRLDELERRVGEHDESLQELLATIRQLIAQPEPVSRPIGFMADIAGVES